MEGMQNYSSSLTANRSFINVSQKYDSHSVTAWFGAIVSVHLLGSILLALLIAASFHSKELLRGSCILIFHIMLIELLICAITNPLLNVTAYLHLNRQFAHVNCRALILLNATSQHALNWASLLLAVNRFVAIVHPHQYERWVSKVAVTSMIIIPWLVGLADTLPVYFGIGGDILLGSAGCAFKTNIDEIYGTIWFVIGAYIPIGLMGVIYLTLGLRILASNRSRQRINRLIPVDAVSTMARVTAAQKRQLSFAKMLIGSSVWYLICFLPGPIIVSRFPHLYGIGNPPIMRLWISGLLALCGYAGCPV
ncbi:hypothetical protein BV898_02109 [Hypsibius exemplaris]|uniref:G-protein coupled receptors family 1 profile domain-containing protein n=1 Tax=Hypsibius exemplaris TaxID=2072580 RepID=A0A1W0X9E6_HYPEX|nr:hypothetical protein BV898_02109 [Hypsibius exemplaris]